ncbi:hypothetical protein E8E11_001834 [Didymella keratinophila]|nr:hypothetical protein E8E11_001834 [Didymella keratinophila]
MAVDEPLHFRISIDRGGTFTDVHASIPGRRDIILKLLSVDPANYQDAPTEGIRRMLELATGKLHPQGQLLNLSTSNRFAWALQSQPMPSLRERGFEDLLLIGNQSRPKIFDLSVELPEVLYEQVVKVDERITMEDHIEDPESRKTLTSTSTPELVTGIAGETIRIMKKPEPEAVEPQIQNHGLSIGKPATDMGFFVTLSSAVQPTINMKLLPEAEVATPAPTSTSRVFFIQGGWTETPVYELQHLHNGSHLAGPALLTIFGYRFMSIAEQMGRTLQKTAVSTNIKERLDFSCAVFSPDGGSVANAPHIPVHLGSMQFAVQYQHKLWEDKLRDGDVLMSNHPSCGGTHLPDFTVITPVFENGVIAFYIASRGHHAYIGGLLPGSMPPISSALWQEGAAIESTKLLADNISDLKAQIAANVKGASLIKDLILKFDLATVHGYMYAIQHTAELAVRDLLRTTVANFGPAPLEAVDYMDDGTPVKLKITIADDGSAEFNFTSTGPQVLCNTNAAFAITHSTIIYCLRALVATDIPLNQGCLNPIAIRVPEASILSPTKGLAVVGGNVLTSQRITDVVLRAFRACAASQGCCNNLTFGTGGKDPETGEHKDGFGYYETIVGSAGAGPTWEGTSGTVRDIELMVPVQYSILNERRSRQPYGMEGGGAGSSGVNLIVRKDEEGRKSIVNLGAKATTRLGSGDRVTIGSPGGGAWSSIDTTGIDEVSGHA